MKKEESESKKNGRIKKKDLDSVIQSLIIYEKRKKTKTLMTLFSTLQKIRLSKMKNISQRMKREVRRQKTK